MTSFINLPTTAANGSGAAVSSAGLGAQKSIVNGGNGGVFEPFVTIEVSNEAAPSTASTSWSPIVTFQGKGEVVFPVAAVWMRAVVSNYRGGGAPRVDVGGELDIQTTATLVASAGNGSGAAVATSALGNFKTIQVSGTFRGTVNIEISENGAADWGTIASFQANGVQSFAFVANFMRVTRTGVPGVSPGTPIVNIAAETGGGGGGGGSGLTSVLDEGIAIGVGPYTIMNFIGAGVAATDAGGGQANVTIPGFTGVAWQDEGGAIVTSGTANFVGAGVVVTNVAGVATITISGGITGVAWQDEGGAIVTSATANFVGAGVTVTNAAGVATVTIPGGIAGVAWQDEGGAIVTSATANFVGSGVTVTNAAGVATVTVPSNAMPLPEQWCQNNVVASQTNVVVSSQVSTNFDDLKMIRAGSIVGFATRLTANVAAGTLTVEITKNGAALTTPFTIVHTAGGNPGGGVGTQAVGVSTYVAGDLIGVRLTTDAGFLPITTDLEAWVEVDESVA